MPATDCGFTSTLVEVGGATCQSATGLAGWLKPASLRLVLLTYELGDFYLLFLAYTVADTLTYTPFFAMVPGTDICNFAIGTGNQVVRINHIITLIDFFDILDAGRPRSMSR